MRVEEAAGVFLEVDALEADEAGALGGLDLEAAVEAEGHVVLGDLVALGEVRVGVVLAVELGVLGDGAAQGEAGEDGVADGLLVDDGEGAGEAEGDGVDEGVGLFVEVVAGAVREHLGAGAELAVDFEADDGLVLRRDVARGGHGVLDPRRYDCTSQLVGSPVPV